MPPDPTKNFFSSGWIGAIFFSLVALGAQDIRASPHASLQTDGRNASSALAFSGDGKLLLAGDADGGIQVFSLENRAPIVRFIQKTGIAFLGFLPGETSFVAVNASGAVTVTDLHKGPIAIFQTDSKPLRAAMDAGRQFLAVATKGGRIEIFDLKAGLPLGQIDARGRLEDLLFLGFDRLAQQLMTIDRKARVSAWNPATLKLLREMTLSGGDLHGSRSVIHSASTNRASNVFVVGLEEAALAKGRMLTGGGTGVSLGDIVRVYSVRAYDWNTGTELKNIKTRAGLDHMALGPGNDHVATIADDERGVTLVDLRRGEQASTVSTEDKPRTLAISPDNQWMAAGTRKGALTVWKLQFRDEASAERPNLPSLSGRIRTTTGTTPALIPGAPLRIAILNFQGKGIPQEVPDICLDSLSNSLANLPYLTLIERKQIEGLLTEQKFQASALTDEGTSIQIGKLLNASKVITCAIGRLGSTTVLTARVLDVETGKVTAGREVICEECRDQDLFDAVKMLATTLAQ